MPAVVAVEVGSGSLMGPEWRSSKEFVRRWLLRRVESADSRFFTTAATPPFPVPNRSSLMRLSCASWLSSTSSSSASSTR